MAQNITSTTINGLFNAGKMTMTAVTGSAKTAELTSEIGGAGDSIYVFVDLTSASSNSFSLGLLPGDYSKSGKKTEVVLIPGELNIVPITSLEVKNYDGTAEFELTTDASTGYGSANVKVGVLKHQTVVSH